MVDRVGAQYLGLWNNAELAQQLGGHRTSPLIEVAARRYGIALAKPELTGDGLATLEAPRPVFFKAIAPFSLPPAPAPAEAPTAHAKHVTAAPSIDGKLEAAWQSAPPVSWQTDFSGADAGIRTSARFLWTEGALFAAFELSGAGLNVDQSRPTNVERSKLYEEDCVELFFTPNPAERERYFEIELGPFGHFFDLEVKRFGKLSNTDWSSGASVAATRDAERHTAVIEARFTAPELTAALVAGARLPFGLFRTEGQAPRRYLAWRPARSPKPNFHLPEGFGVLAVDG